MTRRSRRAGGFQGAVLCLCLAACASDITADGQGAQGRILFDMQELAGRASIMDSVVVTVTTASGGVLRDAARGIGAQAEIAFALRLPPGRTRFAAEVFSNTGILLLSGDTTANIETDGFQVVVQLTRRAPILVVTPDTLRMSWLEGEGWFRGDIVLQNAGARSLRWEVRASDLPFRDCLGADRTCTTMRVRSGFLPSASTPVQVAVQIDALAFADLPREGRVLRITALEDSTNLGTAAVVLVPR